MANSEQYDVNFFRPLSNHAKANTRLIIILATVWAVAVFGFQFLLMLTLCSRCQKMSIFFSHSSAHLLPPPWPPHLRSCPPPPLLPWRLTDHNFMAWFLFGAKRGL